jgi:hypothetical protein
MALSDLESLVLAKLAAHSKPFAGGKGGLDAEEIGRAIGPVGSRALVDVLFSLQGKKLLLCVQTDEHDQHRKLFYLVKAVPSISEP